jgi:hypothetical protein
VEHTCHVLDDRRVAADDGEVAAGAAGLRIGNLQAHQVDAGVDPFGPVEVDVALALLLEDEAVLGVAHLELRR